MKAGTHTHTLKREHVDSLRLTAGSSPRNASVSESWDPGCCHDSLEGTIGMRPVSLLGGQTGDQMI